MDLVRVLSIGAVLFWVSALRPASACAADDYSIRSFDKRVLSDKFTSEGATIADLNRDGHPDVVSGAAWYAGPSFAARNEFRPSQEFNVNDYSDKFFAFTYDFNGDGWDDIFTIAFPGQQASWFENPQGRARHWEQHMVLDTVDNESPMLVDVVGDERPELVCNHQGRIGYAEFDPAHPERPWRYVPVSDDRGYPTFTHGLGVGDVDGDGRKDILEKGGWWQQPVTLGGLWTLHEVPFADAGGAQMLVADLDGDGDSDIVTSKAAHAYGLAWFEQQRTGDDISFVEHTVTGDKPEENPYGVAFSQIHALTLADVDGDEVEDVVTGKRWWAHRDVDPGSLEPAVLYWFQTARDGGTARLIPHLVDDASGVGVQVTAGDVNGDQQPDIVVGNKKGTFVFLQQVKEVDEQTWTAAQPKPLAAQAAPQAAQPMAVAEAGAFLAADASGRPLNLDFETGNLQDWRAEGDVFARQPVRGDTVHPRRADSVSGHKGDFWIGTYERNGDGPKGTLTSASFVVTHPWASFLVGGGSSGATRVEIVQADSGKVIYTSAGYSAEEMRPAAVDLRELAGKEIFLRIVDASSDGWGHVNFDHFRFHDEQPAVDDLKPRVFKADEYPHAGLDATTAAAAMKVPDGFHISVFAAEPDVRQPIAMALDDRGRVWIAEAFEYPIRAPDGQGKDRILIFEDADGDGRFDRRAVFAEGLNLVSGLEVGFGGVWVGAAPYLMFIPDRNGDDVPDGDPQILLDGWAYQDTHETLNAFTWGPDGWLYGCHGVFTHSRVGKPGTPDDKRVPLNAAIWRYHPTRHTFEVFAEGTSNPWGVDFDEHGEAFCTACVIPHLFHIIPGARYNRQAGSHFNPYTYADIPTIADHRHYLGDNPHAGNGNSDSAGGGHAHAGAMIYQGGAWPAEYRGRIFMNNIHGQRVNVDILKPQGSGFVGSHGPDFLLTGDLASQMLNFQCGPDGNVYVIDWYDMNACHHNNVEGHDRSNGRIYKIVYGDAKAAPIDLAKLSDLELAELVLHKNEWHVRHARRLLQERAAAGGVDEAARNRLAEIATSNPEAVRRLRAIWALAVSGDLPGNAVRSMFTDSNEHVRAWAIRLIPELRGASAAQWQLGVMGAANDPSPVVRLAVASLLQKLAPNERWSYLEGIHPSGGAEWKGLLAHAEDAADHNLPLMYWYAMEPLAAVDPPRAIALGLASGRTIPLLREFMLRRVAALGTQEALVALVDRLLVAEDDDQRLAILQGMRQGLEGVPNIGPPERWSDAAKALMSSADENVVAQAVALGVKFGDKASFAWLRDRAAAREVPFAARRDAIRALLAAKDPLLVATLRSLLSEAEMRETALAGLANYDDPAIPGAIIALYPQLSPTEKRAALSTLSSRTGYAIKLLSAINEKQIPAVDLSADLVQQLHHLKSADVDALVTDVWGQVRTTPEEKAKLIASYRDLAASPPAEPDVELGRAVFVRTCQQCHTLYGTGGNVGPDLTGSNRADLEYLLSNVVDPSAVIAKEYQTTTVLTLDGRLISGVLGGEDQHAIKLKTATETLVVPHDDIDTRELDNVSMMPEDQLKQFTPQEVVSLLAYLRRPGQTPILARPENQSLLFNGVDLKGWRGEMELWTVENGELVGRSPGLEHNSFLVSDLAVEDFRLSMEVKLVDNEGNSGVQFRSEPLEDGEMRGYQADIGIDWWGKLYEESGRALLWDKPGDVHVKPGEWNRYEIEAQGSRIRTWINGQLCVDLDDPSGARRGVIALQLHSGGPTEVRFRDLQLKVLGSPAPAP